LSDRSQFEHLAFRKLVATGNDFIFIDARRPLPGAFANASREDISRIICKRNFGIGADGVVFVESDQDSRLRWDFYNSDGSSAEMCGNATRCMGRWAERELGAATVEFQTRVGKVRASVVRGGIASRLSFVRARVSPLSFSIDGENRAAYFVNTGVPHAVVVVDDIQVAARAEREIRALRFHPAAGERGANVTFLEIREKDLFATVTYERGVEGLTLSCGTGVLAAAAVGLELSGGGLSASVQTPGGDLLVRYEEGREGATLSGPAELVFEGQLSEEILK
jgi:diaminopimelate epimerase